MLKIWPRICHTGFHVITKLIIFTDIIFYLMTRVLMNSIQYLLLSEKNPGRTFVIISVDDVGLNSKMEFKFFWRRVRSVCFSFCPMHEAISFGCINIILSYNSLQKFEKKNYSNFFKQTFKNTKIIGPGVSKTVEGTIAPRATQQRYFKYLSGKCWC